MSFELKHSYILYSVVFEQYYGGFVAMSVLIVQAL